MPLYNHTHPRVSWTWLTLGGYMVSCILGDYMVPYTKYTICRANTGARSSAHYYASLAPVAPDSMSNRNVKKRRVGIVGYGHIGEITKIFSTISSRLNLAVLIVCSHVSL